MNRKQGITTDSETRICYIELENIMSGTKKGSDLFSIYLNGKRIFVKRGTFDAPSQSEVIHKVSELAEWNKTVQIYERTGYYMIHYNAGLVYVIDVMGAGLTVYVADCVDTYYTSGPKA